MYVRLFFCLIFFFMRKIRSHIIAFQKNQKFYELFLYSFCSFFSYHIFKNNDGKKPINFLLLSPLVKN